MAGETTGTTLVTRDARLSRGKTVTAIETDAIATGELEAADVTLYRNIRIPSNAIITDISVYNDDLDSNCTPTLTIDLGLAATEDFTSTTSSTDTNHLADAVLDADAYVDGSTAGQAATTSWTSQAFDSATFGPDDCEKACWEVLGYDNDPKTTFCLACTFPAAAATAAAGDLAFKVTYLVD